MKNSSRPVVITLHGIRTRGTWQKQIAPLIARHGMIPVLLDYGYFNLFQFLNPWSRNKQVKWLRDQVDMVNRDFPGAPVSLVAHSLGTYLVARLLSEESAFRFQTLLFSGSIVRTDFDWSRHLNAFRVSFVANYVARRDVWPGLASRVIRGANPAGRAGVEGFGTQHVALFQHTHRSYGHSDYFSPHTFEVHWLPQLVFPQRQYIEILSALLFQAEEVLAATPATQRCALRTRVLTRAPRGGDFLQLPGQHCATRREARYDDDELEYRLVPDASKLPQASCPPAFQAAFSGQPMQWLAAPGKPPRIGRKDVLVVNAAPLKRQQPDGSEEVVAMLVLEVLNPEADNPDAAQVAAIAAVAPTLLKHTVHSALTLQSLYPAEWP